MRALMVVLATVPLVGVNVSELWKLAPLSEEISTPAGAVRVRGPVRLLALTVKVVAVPAVPAVAVPRLSVLGVRVMAGVVTALTVPVAATFCAVAPVLVSVMLPVTGPCAAAELMRALIVVAATVPEAGVSVTEFEKVVPPLE